MINKAITDAEKRIKEILSARETELNDIRQQIEEEEKILKGYEAATDKAKKDGKAEAYKEALKKCRDSRDVITMYREREKELAEKPLITPGEYETLKSNIMCAFVVAQDEAYEKLYKHSKEMQSIASDMSELYQASNKTLLRLQRDIYRDADRKRTIYGHIIDNPISIKNNPAVYWAEAPTRTQMFLDYEKNLKGERK